VSNRFTFLEKGMNKMIQKKAKIIIFISLSLFCLLACTGTKERFREKIANQDDQIHIISSSTDSGVWNTKELSVNYTYTSLPDYFNLTGYISISEYITNTYSKIRSLSVQVIFLDNNGKLVGTTYINPIYSVNSNPPRKIKFNSNLSLPAEAVAFCFSYSGEFKGDGGKWDSLYIGNNPFH
jgi:hypothetical protein